MEPIVYLVGGKGCTRMRRPKLNLPGFGLAFRNCHWCHGIVTVRVSLPGLLELASSGGGDAQVPMVGRRRKRVQLTRLFKPRRPLTLRDPQLEASDLSGAQKAARRRPPHTSTGNRNRGYRVE